MALAIGALVGAPPAGATAPIAAATAAGSSGPADLCRLDIRPALLAPLQIGPGCAATPLKAYPASWVKSFPDYAGLKFKSSFWGQPGSGLTIAVYPKLSAERLLKIWPNGEDADPLYLETKGNYHIGTDPGFYVASVSDENDNGLFVIYSTSNETRRYYAPVLAIARAVTNQL
ncbi:MAG TPA: hypothetical protein VME46_16340 [Acidimicrobiales bacterium]|nr:hypothetical protein [Acidimicrobiales bacterium]